MPTQYIGELAALTTALMFAFGSMLFTLAGHELGSMLVNRVRLVLAVFFVMVLHYMFLGTLFPTEIGNERWFWLGLSGIAGLALGDASLFQAFVMIGPRISMLVMALAPVLGAVMAWAFLGEILSPVQLVGITVTIVGIGFVVTEKQKQKLTIDTLDLRTYMIGLLFAFGGAIGQASGLIFAKIGIGEAYPSISALFVRLLVAMVVLWSVSLIRGDFSGSYRELRSHPRAAGFLTLASFTGPAVGVWFSLVAIQRSTIGVATTLMALTPVFLIPIAYVAFHERSSARAIIGTLIAFSGTALLFW